MNRFGRLLYLLTPLLLTALPVPGGAQTLEIVEHTSELRLANVQIPIVESGVVTVRLCPSCDAYSLRVTPDTEYLGFDGPVSFAEFRALVTRIRLTPAGNQTTGACVTYEAGSQLVTGISLHRDMFSPAGAE